MGWRQKLFSNIILRSILADLGERSAYSKKPGGFIPYFQYRIGPYRSDEYLYFPKEPFPLLYKNEIFNKLHEYTGYDIIRYLEFHYAPYPDSRDFLRFLHYEISERLKKQVDDARLLSALSWVKEKMEELQNDREKLLRDEIERGVQDIIRSQGIATPQEIDNQVRALSEKLGKHIEQLRTEAEQIMTATEKGIQGIAGSLGTGNIQLNNHNHEEKLIQLLILLQEVKAPLEQGRVEQLFKRFTAADIAAILHLHFDAFRDNKINTLQRKVGDQSERIKANNPKIKRLTEALQDFFY